MLLSQLLCLLICFDCVIEKTRKPLNSPVSLGALSESRLTASVIRGSCAVARGPAIKCRAHLSGREEHRGPCDCRFRGDQTVQSE